MLLWTVIPEEVVLEGVEKPRQFRQIKYQNRDVVVEMGEEGMGTVVQVLSTDPRDFLLTDITPGKKIPIN
ncbi:MAG: YlzJ-like family protein [Bacillota bacterium]|nr:hypothetical protein [Clostridia bacterium]